MSYGFEATNRLTGITQGTSMVGLAYDAADCRTTLTLANGVTVSYGYDTANELTGLTYRDGSNNLLGDLTYGYDAAGRRSSAGGSFARTGLPDAVTSNTFDANNRASAWNGTALNYDANGNLLGFAGDTYSWDSRDELAAISGTDTAAFQYDALRRRQAKTVGGTQTAFLYDGANPVQELSGSTVTANLLTGLAIDEVFARTEGAATSHYLADALGSTIRLTDSAATKLLDYTYEPYGKMSADAVTGNAFQYTGRENDGTGLYYYRARYMSPVMGRFVSEDPIGPAGGENLYQYAFGSPISDTDPSGRAVYVGEHGAAFPSDPFQHTAIVLRPDDPAAFNFPNNTWTLGGQPGGSWWTSWSIYGNLHSVPNYPGDSPGSACAPGPLGNLTPVATPPGMSDTQFIKALMNASNSYQNNRPYYPVPDPFGIFYNSNSYTSGVIRQAGGVPPALPGNQPGYEDSLPIP